MAHSAWTNGTAKVAWEGLEQAESTREPVSRVFHDAPAVLRKELKVLRLIAELKRALMTRYGMGW